MPPNTILSAADIAAIVAGVLDGLDQRLQQTAPTRKPDNIISWDAGWWYLNGVPHHQGTMQEGFYPPNTIDPVPHPDGEPSTWRDPDGRVWVLPERLKGVPDKGFGYGFTKPGDADTMFIKVGESDDGR